MKVSTQRTRLAAAIVLAILVVPGLAITPASATDGICWRQCEIALAGCYSAANCWVGVCRDDGGPCDGFCSQCDTFPCYNAGCQQAYQQCMEGCRDWQWMSALSVLNTLEIPSPVRQDLDNQLVSLQQEIEAAVQTIETALATRLGHYRTEIETLRDNQTLDADTANGLIEVANSVEESLGGGALLDHVSDSPPNP